MAFVIILSFKPQQEGRRPGKQKITEKVSKKEGGGGENQRTGGVSLLRVALALSFPHLVVASGRQARPRCEWLRGKGAEGLIASAQTTLPYLAAGGPRSAPRPSRKI